MARKGSKKSSQFDVVIPEIEDEIIQCYSQLTSDDLYLRQLPEFFQQLAIHHCFVYDIEQCIEYYYTVLAPLHQVSMANRKHYTTLNMISSFTISPAITKLDDIIDIVDIDKLIIHTNRLIKFRNNYNHIYESWCLFTSQINVELPLKYSLTLPDLNHIKQSLNLDTAISSSILIDMLSCSVTDSTGNVITFDFNSAVPSVSIKNFAMILGNLGELD
jgi:hypothetical protein